MDKPQDKHDSFETLERILLAQLEGHKRLLPLLQRKREAIRTADIGAVTEVCEQEQTITHRLGELEKHRLMIVGELTAKLNPKAAEPMTLAAIAEQTDEPNRTKLLAAAAQLREIINKARRISSVIRNSADALAQHMSGVMQSVHGALSQARVYSSGGQISSATISASTVDIKS